MGKIRIGFEFFLGVSSLLDFGSFGLRFVLAGLQIFPVTILVLQVKIFAQWPYCFGWKLFNIFPCYGLLVKFMASSNF